MAVRTTGARVQGVLLSDYGETLSGKLPDLTPFIATASLITDELSTKAAADGNSLSDARLEMIERWLSAHCYAMSDQPYEERSTGGSRGRGAYGKFQGKTGMYLEASKYGQMALSLDPTGILAQVANGTRNVVQIGWLGLPPSEQTDYEDRD